MSDIVTYEAYLVLRKTRAWWDIKGRLAVNKPTKLLKGEVPVRLVVSVPRALFDDPPILTVRAEATPSPTSGELEAAMSASGLGVVVVREPALTPGPSPDAGEGSGEEATDE